MGDISREMETPRGNPKEIQEINNSIREMKTAWLTH